MPDNLGAVVALDPFGAAIVLNAVDQQPVSLVGISQRFLGALLEASFPDSAGSFVHGTNSLCEKHPIVRMREWSIDTNRYQSHTDS